MKRVTAMILVSALLALGLTLLQSVTPVSSSPMLAITLTPTPRTPPTEEPPDPVLPRTGAGIYSSGVPAGHPLGETANPLASIDPITRMVIPSLGVNSGVTSILLKGREWDVSQLGIKTGWLESAAHPEQGSNTVVVGHLNLAGYGAGPFQKLSQLTPGATVQLYTENYIYTYQVRSQRVVDETDLSVVAPTSRQQLTMITCSSWDVNRQEYVKRLVATADLVNKQLISTPNIKLMKYYFYVE